MKVWWISWISTVRWIRP